MKVGDTVPVMIGGHVVAQARIREMNNEQATLIVPATMVVMGIRTSLEDVPEVPQDTSGTETVITGVDRASGGDQSATVEDNVNISSSSETSSEQTAPEQSANVEVSTDGNTSTEVVETPPTPVEPAAPVETPVSDASGGSNE